MPIKRGGDGEIVEEPTEPVRGRDGARAANAAEDKPTDPVAARSGRDADSLFEPRSGAKGHRLEEPTVAMGAERGGDGKTRIVAPRRRTDEAETPADDPMLDPPVGWLVVVRGPGKGRVLTLGNGMNVMGRGPNARVRIDFGDDTIARANHARLVYEPRQRVYLLSHGEGANLTYLNRNVVTETVEIESGAMIEVGETTLRFQAFCTKEFDWPDLDD